VPDTLSDFIQILISRQIFIKVISTKFHGSWSSGGSADTCGKTVMKNQIDAYRYYANAPKNQLITPLCL